MEVNDQLHVLDAFPPGKKSLGLIKHGVCCATDPGWTPCSKESLALPGFQLQIFRPAAQLLYRLI